ncbi:mechanosensitive ion channel family protein [Coleofasciculus sp. G2-EDA-02]|uniref:mechanosensitive ion channel family protein n=1 Tax=unclassified Coleofasciculus TaxID=2692782 RepID=UPI0032F54A87
MESFLEFLNNINIDISGIPVVKTVIVILVLTLIQVFRRLFISVVIKTIERFTRKTDTTLDDELIAFLKPALSWIISLAGLWISQLILADELGPKLTETIEKTLNLLLVFVIAYLVYRGAYLFGNLIAAVMFHSESDVDEVLKPLIPKIFQAVAIILLAIKVSEMLLGQSAAAIAGLLGGAGITLGLLFKDILYDWFCTFIIYSDNLYREGDWVGIQGVNGFVQIMQIGFRTTTLHITNWGSIVKMPNSKMISGIVENWSQNPGDELKWGLNLTLKIDGISAKQTERICQGIREIIPTIKGVSPSGLARFTRIEQNARVIEIRAFVYDDNLYFDAETQLNLAILELLEKEGIDFLYIDLETQPEKLKSFKAANN